MKIIFIADFFANQVVGGGELNNNELIELLKSQGFEVECVNSHLVSPKFIKENHSNRFIVANFANLSKISKTELVNNKYVIYEHDHKYLKSRDPSFYPNYVAPPSEIINLEFYQNALKVYCQSQFHLDIVYSNTNLENLENLSGNLWALKTLELLKELSLIIKEPICSIMESRIPHKNTKDAIKYCVLTNQKYDLVADNDYHGFLKKIGKNKTFIFFPMTPETLSRVSVEARMLGMSVILNDKIGAAGEPWFALKGPDLIEEVASMRGRILKTVLNGLLK